MLRSLKDLQNYKIHAIDGDIGSVDSFIFNDLSWNTKYLVVDIGSWLSAKMVLISPYKISEADGAEKIIFLKSTKEEIEHSPSLMEDKPVSLIKEEELKKEQQIFLLPRSTPSGAPVPPQTVKALKELEEFKVGKKEYGYLRSTKEVLGYKLHAKDGEIGHVEDFIVEDTLTWTIHYMVVDTGTWLPGKKVLVSPRWIDRVSWENKEVMMDLMKDKIKDCPEFDPVQPVNREYESILFDYYGKPRYWE